MDSNGPRTVPAGPRGLPASAQIELIAPSASPEEAAAIVAALERFMRATAAPPSRPAAGVDGWRRAAMLEAVMGEDDPDLSHPWINT
jgi:hypothetical protein